MNQSEWNKEISPPHERGLMDLYRALILPHFLDKQIATHARNLTNYADAFTAIMTHQAKYDLTTPYHAKIPLFWQTVATTQGNRDYWIGLMFEKKLSLCFFNKIFQSTPQHSGPPQPFHEIAISTIQTAWLQENYTGLQALASKNVSSAFATYCEDITSTIQLPWTNSRQAAAILRAAYLAKAAQLFQPELAET